MKGKIIILNVLVALMVLSMFISTASATVICKSTTPLITNESAFPLSWSPSGTKIAYLEATEPGGKEGFPDHLDLWIMNVDETGKIQLSTVESNLGEAILFGYGVDWTPDGKSIVYMEAPDHDNRAIWVMNVETKEKIKLASNAACPSWSPDGMKIVYMGFSFDSESWDLWVMNADGGSKIKLAQKAGFYSWSPDGTKIVYVKYSGGRNNVEEVWVANVDGTGNTKLASNAAYPQWSPDGRKIAYLSDDGLWTMNIDGTEKTLLKTEFKEIYSETVKWSPDSTKIAYTLEKGGLGVVNTDGSGKYWRIPNAWYGSWSPDGKRIAYISEPGNIHIINADGTKRQQLILNASFPLFSPDGTKIVYASIERRNFTGIWMATLEVVETTPASSRSEKKRIPGFEIVFAIAGVLAIAYLLRRVNRCNNK